MTRHHQGHTKIAILHYIYSILLLILPLILFFSYYPLIPLGSDQTMNLELSLPFIWLILFDFLGFVIIAQTKSWPPFSKVWPWLLFPFFLTLSVLWSLNPLRGFLTAGILWLIAFAIICFFSLKDVILYPPFVKRFSLLYKSPKTPQNMPQRVIVSGGFVTVFWRCFFAATLIACAWCWLQSFLDLSGLPQEGTLMCDGCTTQMFGFPHPNGFAIEPQFMGNLLLAPALFAAWFAYPYHRRTSRYSDLLYSILFFILSATLFLTFSRGAIYAFIIGMIVLTAIKIAQVKSPRPLRHWLIILVAFLFTLNFQGIMAALSPTNDTYQTGVTKALHQLSLGQLDLRPVSVTEQSSSYITTTDITGQNSSPSTDTQSTLVSTQVVHSGDNISLNPSVNQDPNSSAKPTSVFDGYIESSTNARVNLTVSALYIWQTDPRIMLFGVGLGGAGQALYDYGESPTPKEIVQNQYSSLLLETGLVGCLLAFFTLYLFCRLIRNNPFFPALAALLVSYAITLFFFSGLPNALHIYLLPPLIVMISALGHKPKPTPQPN